MKNAVHRGIRKTLIASFLSLGALLPSQADSIRRGYYNGWGYIVTPDNTITIKTWLGGKGCREEIVVPGEIDGLPVTRISDWVRFDLKVDPYVPDWKAIYIGEDPTDEELDCRRLVIDGLGSMVIEGDAFHGIPGLREVVLRGVKTIENSGGNIAGAFRGCPNLETVVADGCLDSIGEQAFRDNPKLAHLTGATNLTHIGGNAFFDDSKLESIPVSDKLDSIDFNAFMNCTAFDEIRFPDSLSSIGAHAFAGCTNLEEITFGSGLKKIPSDNFNSKPRLRKITIPEGVEEIAGRAFEGCSALPEVVFPDSLKDPGYWSFADCPAITNIVIGKNGGMAYVRDSVFSADKMLDLDTVTINGNGETVINGKGGAFNSFKMRHLVLNGVKTIEDTNSGGAFRNCTNLVSVVADDALEHVGVWAFAGCTALTTLEGFQNVTLIGNSAFADCTSLPTINVPSKVGTIDSGAFARCTSATTVVIPDSVTDLGGGAFTGCTAIRSVSLGKGLGRIGEIIPESAVDLDTVVIDGNGETVVSANAFTRRKLRHLVLKGVKSFDDGNGGGAFSSCTNLQTVVADESLARIGAWTFSGCTALTSVEGVTAVTSIGAHGFEGCTSLPELPDFPILADLGGNGAAFSGCTSMTNAVIPDTVTNMNDRTFSNCTGLRSITLGKGWSPIVQNLVPQGAEDLDTIIVKGNGETVIAGGAFFRCKMRHLVMSGVKTIDGSCKECPNLEDVVADESLETIGSETFRACPKLRSVTGITGVKVIGENAFGNYHPERGCPALAEIELPEGLERIGECAFANCTNLTDVTVPDTVTNVGWRVWMRCHGLTNFTFGAGLNPIPGGLFDWCEATMDVLAINGDGTTAIADGAFNGMQIKCVVLNGVAKIGNNAFQGNSVLTEVYFDGDAPTVGANAFGGVVSNCTAYVPYGSTGWGVKIPGVWQGMKIAYLEPVTGFVETNLAADESSNVIVRVFGGNMERTSSVKVYLKYTGASSSDLDLAKTLVNGKAVSKSFKFPVTLTWAAGELGEKTITFKMKKDSSAEGPETFTLQLGAELGLLLDEARTATVTIGDTSANPLKATVKNPSKTKGVKKYDVTVASADETAGLVAGSGSYYRGAKLTVKAKAKTGYVFSAWYDSATGRKLSTSANYTFTVSKAVTLEARFSKRYYVRALADPADGATVSGSGWYAKNKTATLKAKAKSHFKFLGWYAAKADDPNAPDMTKKLSGSTTFKPKVTGDLGVFACYRSDPRLEIFKTSGGSVSGASKYAKGKTATLKAKVSKGYAFLGWYDANGNRVSQATSYKYKMGAENVVFTAQFKKESALAAPVLDWNAATEFPVGVSYSAKPKVSCEAAVKIVKVTGLPAGLSYKSGKVSGAPTAAKTYTVSVTVALATNAKKTWTLKQKLVVEALPAWAKGTFNGGSETTPMQATLTIGSTGKVSGKLCFANAVWTLSGTKYSKLDLEARTATLSLTAKKGTTKKTVAVTVYEGQFGGFALSETKGFAFEAQQNLWKSDDFMAGFLKDWAAQMPGKEYSDLADGLTVKFGQDGTVTAKLKVGKNTFSATTVFSLTAIGEATVSGKLYLYFAPNATKKFKGAVRVVEFQSWYP